MPNGSEINASTAEQLSALADGELEDAGVSAVLGAWRTSPSARSRWHSYQLIGDVLRSEDLASSTSRDALFLAALRTRLASEPVVLAPEPLVPQPVEPMSPAAAHGSPGGSVSAAAGRRWSWIAPSAVAAGFVAIAGMLMVAQAPTPGIDSGSTLASSRPVTAGAVVAGASALGASSSFVEPTALVADGQLIRDARLDRYLAAHKQFAGVSVLGTPSAFVRSAAANAPKN